MNDPIEEAIQAIINHPAIQHADAATILQAARTGTKGYEGPNLKYFLRTKLQEAEARGEKKAAKDFSTLSGGFKAGYRSGAEATKAAAIEKIGAIKGKVQTISGSYKYDSCYDDCINVLKSLPVDSKEV